MNSTMNAKLMPADVPVTSSQTAAVLFHFAFRGRSQKIDDLYRAIKVPISAKGADEICRDMSGRGVLRCISDVKTVASRRYEIVRPLSYRTIKSVVKFANEGKWFESAARSWWYHDPINDYRIFRALVSGGSGIASAFESKSDSNQMQDVYHFVSLAAAEKPFPLSSLPPDAPERLYVLLSAFMFPRGIDFSPLLACWREEVKARGRFGSDEGALVFWALCVWTGHAGWLEDAPADGCRDAVATFRDACSALVAGDVETAYKEMSPIVSISGEDWSDNEKFQFAIFPATLLALAVTAFHKPMKARIQRLAQRLMPYSASRRRSNLTIGTKRCVDDRINRMAEYWPLLDSYMGFIDDSEDADSRYRGVPVYELGKAFCSLAAGLDRKTVVEDRANLIAASERAVLEGVPTMAGVFLSVFGWAFDGEFGERAIKVAESATAAGAVWFRPYDAEGSSAWKAVVKAFAERLPELKQDQKKASAAAKGRIVWALHLRPTRGELELMCDSDEGNRYAYERGERIAVDNLRIGGGVECTGFTVCLRGPRGADDGSNDKPLTRKAIDTGKYDALFTDSDRRAWAAGKERYWGKCATSATVAFLESLDGADNVTSCCRELGSSDNSFRKIAFRRRSVPLTVETTVDGGTILSVPEKFVGSGRSVIVCKAGENEFDFTPLDTGTTSVLDVFREYGANGKIAIPKAGMEEMRPLMGRLGAMFPIQGDLAAIGEGTGLERVSGDATPLVRLEFADGVLDAALRVRPIADAPDIVVEPGSGQPERIVNLKSRTIALVRDLAAERKNAVAASDVLKDFGGWADGKGNWRVESLVDALGFLAALHAIGDEVRLEWRGGEKLKVASVIASGARWSASEGAERWFSVKGEFQLDDGRVMSVVKLVEALRNRTGDFVAFGEGDYIRLSSEILRRIEALSAAGRAKNGALEVPPSAAPALSKAFGGADALPDVLRERAAEYERILSETVRMPERLKATLRPYQEEGFGWMSRLAACGFGACLADDMGLGKTVQAIALLLARAADGPSLVVAPASVCGNWLKEIARFAPSLKTVAGWDFRSDGALAPGDVVVASYGIVVIREEDFAGRKWNGVVLDEAQAIKNEATKRARAVRRFEAKFRVLATGTPVENRLTELWSLFEFLNPGLLGPLASFSTRLTTDGRATPTLKRLVAPFILRRLKREVLDDLPPKTEITIPVELPEEERTAYEGCRRHALATLEEGGRENRISILAELTRLRRFCSHPSLVLPEFKSSAKLDALVELLSELKSNGHRALVFSQFTDYLAIVRRALEERGWTYRYLDGATPAKERMEYVDAFQRGDGDFFLISLKAGGMGLNLTAANYVVLLDPWWNPAVENQAADRVHRIGQTDPVTVYRLIAADTVEERVLELHGEKKAVAEDVLDGTGSSALTPDDLMKLFN